jgi:hypothetical protein
VTEFLVLVLLAVGVPVAVRWVVPIAARTLLALIVDIVAVLAAVLVLPDYYASTAARRRTRPPPAWAYGYGWLVVDALSSALLVVRRLLRGLAVAAHAAPPVPVAVVAVVLGLLGVVAS